jgi:hypothetical protein
MHRHLNDWVALNHIVIMEIQNDDRSPLSYRHNQHSYMHRYLSQNSMIDPFDHEGVM